MLEFDPILTPTTDTMSQLVATVTPMTGKGIAYAAHTGGGSNGWDGAEIVVTGGGGGGGWGGDWGLSVASLFADSFGYTTQSHWYDMFSPSATNPEIEFDALGDDDGDGIANQDEVIVVTSTSQMRDAAVRALDSATWQVNFALDGIAALSAGVGYLGGLRAAMGAAAANQEINNWRDAWIERRAEVLYHRDGFDGVYDGQTITDDNIQLPPIPW